MRIAILGGSGMLGHKIWQIFAPNHDTYVLARKPYSYVKKYDIFDSKYWISGIDILKHNKMKDALNNIRPDIIINCVGIIKQVPSADNPILTIKTNSLLPHILAQECEKIGARLIHFSTDCVFSGNRGNYNENDIPDPTDFYGRSKLLGEVYRDNCITIRTSIIGRELNSNNGLLQWFLSSEGKKIKGFNNAIFSGFTTKALSEIIYDIATKHKELNGLYHISSSPISKYDLLIKLKNALNFDIEIEPFYNYRCNRSLDSYKYKKITDFVPPSWDEMIDELVNDKTKYNTIN